MPSAPTSRANCAASGSMCGSVVEWSAMRVDVEEHRAGNVTGEILRLGVALERGQIERAVDHGRRRARPRRAASQSVVTSQREEGAWFGIVNTLACSYQDDMFLATSC